MGLDIAHTTLKSVLRDHYADQVDRSRLIRSGLELVEGAIELETGREAIIREGRVPRDLQAADRYGSASAIHVLRAFACHTAGVTLAEVYRTSRLFGMTQLPQPKKRKIASKGEAPTRQPSTERWIERAWEIKLNEVAPRTGTKIRPFPYLNLVNFCDGFGIYVPEDFPKPLILDGLWIGSGIALARELRQLKNQITKARAHCEKEANRNGTAFLKEVEQLRSGLHAECAVGIRGNFSTLFT